MSSTEAAFDVSAAAPAALRARAARRVGAVAVLALGAALAPSLAERWPVARELSLVRGSGLVAALALLATLAIGVFMALRQHGERRERAAVLRRTLGMTAAWLALVHAALAFFGPLRSEPAALMQTSHLYSGLHALGVLALLLLTSFASVVRTSRLRFWKELHRLAWVAALLVLQHVALAPGASRMLVLGAAAALLTVLGARVLAALTARTASRIT